VEAHITAGESAALLTVKEQEAQRKGVAERRGLKQLSARSLVRNASEHDSARQAGEPASQGRSQVRLDRKGRHSPSTVKGGCPELVGRLVAEWEIKGDGD
jgi:hypothetical protein